MQKSYIDIRSRKEMFHCFLGNFRSRFHGSGMEFRDFHPYNYSSDAKNIDWAVSSRQTFPVMRRYHEEKEATIYIVIDITSYLDVSHNPQEKTIRDVTELLAYSAEKS